MNSEGRTTPTEHGETRRQAVGVAGAAGAALLLTKVSGPDRLLGSLGIAEEAQAAATSCVLIPAKTEGPYFVDEKLDRSDIRADPGSGTMQSGTPLNLTIVVVRADASCAPVPGAVVDIWHANAAGKYSDIASEGTSGQGFLRGLRATIATRTVTGVTAGVRSLELAIPRKAPAGTARLTMTYTDGAGLTKTVRKSVRVPKKRLV